MHKLFASSALAMCLAPDGAQAFVTYSGGLAAESDWQAAAGTTVLETFDSYAGGTQIQILTNLGVGFDPIYQGNQYPGIYIHPVANTPSQPHQLSNMPDGTPQGAFQNLDIELYVLSGYTITALGFWNGDPNGPMVITVYDEFDNVLGSVSAPTNPDVAFGPSTLTFVGFVSDIPFARIHFEGATGDGWNHIDDMQTNWLPEPTGALRLGIALLAALSRKRRRR
jgi:hypothetical protein